MTKYLIALLTIYWLAWLPSAHAGLVVVVNKDNPVASLSTRQVIDLYMGRYTSYPDGRAVNTTDLPDNSPEREDFYRQLVGKSVAQINAYWARLLFTGKAEPPSAKSSSEDVVMYVEGNSNAIAYLHENSVTPGLKVVYRFDDPQ
ncbi:hypothetical protein [Enterovibrio norvegicus]|uniref:hypothetical protein n=1 Tax=Enterovibrio norvegicus TaxID=188144 RepID=UPI001F53D32C|nr:hypothetical protein [Enterovibrio norvegicus]